MKLMDYSEMEETNHNEKLLRAEIVVDNNITMGEKLIQFKLKQEIYAKLEGFVKTYTCYMFKLYYDVIDLKEQNSKRHIMYCEYQIANSIKKNFVSYDDMALRVFKQPKKFFARLKLAFKYIFRKDIREK